MAKAHENNQPTIQDGGPNEDWGLNEERTGSTRLGDRAGSYVSLSGGRADQLSCSSAHIPPRSVRCRQMRLGFIFPFSRKIAEVGGTGEERNR